MQVVIFLGHKILGQRVSELEEERTAGQGHRGPLLSVLRLILKSQQGLLCMWRRNAAGWPTLGNLEDGLEGSHLEKQGDVSVLNELTEWTKEATPKQKVIGD